MYNIVTNIALLYAFQFLLDIRLPQQNCVKDPAVLLRQQLRYVEEPPSYLGLVDLQIFTVGNLYGPERVAVWDFEGEVDVDLLFCKAGEDLVLGGVDLEIGFLPFDLADVDVFDLCGKDVWRDYLLHVGHCKIAQTLVNILPPYSTQRRESKHKRIKRIGSQLTCATLAEDADFFDLQFLDEQGFGESFLWAVSDEACQEDVAGVLFVLQIALNTNYKLIISQCTHNLTMAFLRIILMNQQQPRKYKRTCSLWKYDIMLAFQIFIAFNMRHCWDLFNKRDGFLGKSIPGFGFDPCAQVVVVCEFEQRVDGLLDADVWS